MVEVTSQLFRYYSRYYCQILCQWALTCVAFYTNDSTSWLIGSLELVLHKRFPYRMVGYLSSVCVQFCFQGHIFHEGVDLIDTHSLFFVPDHGFRVFNKGDTKRTISSHLFRSVGNQRFEEGDWTKRRPPVANIFGWIDLLFLLRPPCGSWLGFLQVLFTQYLDRPCSS